VTIRKSHLFVLLFITLALYATYLSYQTIPHSLVIHFNNRWHLMLVGETQSSHVDYHARDFVTINSNSANLWLNGAGQITWKTHQLEVSDVAIRINNQVVSRDNPHSEIHLMLYPDGHITKGKYTLSH
jgi:hypothetical protein